ncbi:MAG: hypothetical protein J6033_07655, partial [Lachnospiraceae bacterium]|nr:hypothetical protein [Lachnospiraceae bacterium]
MKKDKKERKTLSFSKGFGKKSKTEPSKDPKKKIKLFSIRNKIFVCFLMPIIGLIIVGVVAYNRAEKGLSENYISSTTQTVEMAKEYIDQGCNYVNAETIKFCSNSDLQQLMLGLFANDQVSALNITSTVKTDMNASIVANEFINAIHIIPKSNFNVISSKTTSTQTGFMSEYLDSMGADKYSIPRWVDNHAFLDERINTSP